MPAAPRLWLSFLLVFVALTARAEDAALTASVTASPAAGATPEGWLSRGAWTDRVPLDLPPAPGGLTPDIAFIADPGVREGLMGMGWTLAGLSRVERRDPLGGVPMTFDNNEDALAESSFRLDGQRLYLNAQTDCYEAEQQDGRCVEYDDEANVWTVRKDGWRWTYGSRLVAEASDDGFIIEILRWLSGEDPIADACEQYGTLGLAQIPCVDGSGSDVPTHLGESSAWLLTEVQNPFGQTITWDYRPSDYDGTVDALGDSEIGGTAQGAPLPEHVTYGAAEITFEYEPRDDWRIDGLGGSFVALTERLVAIEASVSDSFFSRFTVDYAEEPDLATLMGSSSTRPSETQQPLSIVTTIQRETSSGSAKKTLRSVSWNDEVDAWDTVGEDLSAAIPEALSETGWVNLPSDLGEVERAWTRGTVANLNGDGRPDLILVSYACAEYDGDPDGTDASNTGDDDLFVDALVTKCGVLVRAYVNKPSSLPISEFMSRTGPPSFVLDETWTDKLQKVFETHSTGPPLAHLFGDVNRDGWTDLIYERSSTGGVTQAGVTMLQFDPLARDFVTHNLAVWPNQLRSGQLADLNGDGWLDLLVSAGERNITGSVVPDYSHVIFNSGEAGAWLTSLSKLDEATSHETYDLELLLPLDELPLSTYEPDGWDNDCYGYTYDNDDKYYNYPSSGEGAYSDADSYRSAQARFADFNNDGLLDVAYALYACWDPDRTSANNGATPVEGSEYSRIFYGDGRRRWRDSGLSAGEPWLISADPHGTGSSETGLNHLSDSFFSMVDLGRSGRPALIQYGGLDDDGALPAVRAGYDWGVRYGFFEPSGDPWPADVDLNVSGLGGRYPHERQVILADFDGDGFVDQLRLFTERDSELDPDFASVVSYSVTFHAHTRDTTQGRMTDVVGPWGGTTELIWGFTANLGGNNGPLDEEDDPLARLETDDSALRWLHTNEEILVAMGGAEGHRQYRYLHGLHDGERFRGFGVVERHNQSGSVEEHGFAVSRPLMGASVYSARYDEDHVLEHLIVNAHASPMSPSRAMMSEEWGLDVRPPYFNPLRRQCVIELDKTETSPPTIMELVEECFTLDGGTISWQEWIAAIGFLRYPDENLHELLTNILIADGNDTGSFQAAEGMFPVDEVIAFTGRFDAQGAAAASFGFTDPLTTASALDTTGTYDGVALPERADPPAAIAGLSGYRMNVTDWEYGLRGLLRTTTQRRDPYVDDDDLYTSYTYETFDDGAWGAALATATITSGDGLTPYETTTRADFHPGAFDLPGTVTRCGSSTASADCVTTSVVWDHGDSLFYGVPKSQTFIDDSTEETVVDPTCGVVTSTTDRAGRVLTRTLDSLCRVVSESFEGALITTSYDSFNRVSLTTTDPDADDGDSSDTLTEQHFYEDDLTYDDKATLTSGGRLELLVVDGWGRPEERRSCPGALGSTGKPTCTGDEKIAAWVYLDDGTVGWEIRPHFDGEAFETLAYTYDHAGRVVAQVSPGADGAEALTTWQHAPGVSVRIDALGVEERVEFDFLTEERLLNGLSRRLVVRDAYGRLLSDTDATGLTREIAYDALHRVNVETLVPSVGDTSCTPAGNGAPTVASCPTLTWVTEHDLINRAVQVTDPLGVLSAQAFDPIGRPVSSSIDGVTLVDTTHTDRLGAIAAMTTTTDETGEELVITRDGLGRVITETTLAGTTFTTYGPDGMPLSVTDVDGRTRTFERDVWGAVLAICAPSGWDGSACATPLVQHTLDAQGRVLTTTDADGVTWTAERGPGGVLQRLLQGEKVLEEHDYDALGRPVFSLVDGVERAFVYDSLGRVTTVTIGDGERVTTLAYDDADRVIGATITPTHGTGSATTTYDYGAYGWLIGVTEAGESTPRTMLYDPLGRARAVTEPGGASARRDYDSRGRVIFSQAPGGAPSTFRHSVPHSFDGETNLRRVLATDGEGNVSATFTDALGRLIGERLPDGTAYRHHFQGSERWAVEHQAFGGAPLAMTVTHYDAELGLPVMEWGWFGSPYTTSSPAYADFGLADPADQVITSAYSAAGRLIELDNGASLTEFSYDADGFLSSESWDDGAQTKSWLRDEFGRPTSETWLGSDGLNTRVRGFTYDSAGRLISESISDSFTGESLTTTWDDLDAYGNAAITERLLNGASLSAWTATYDDQGRLTSRTTAIEGFTVGTVSWTWNDDDTLSAVTTPSGAELSYHYTTSGPQRLLSEVRLDGATMAEIVRRDGNLRADRVDFGGGRQRHSLRYDRMGRLDKRWTNTSSALSAPALTWEGDYDDRGRLVAEHVTTGSTTDTSSFTYAEPGWLIDEQHTRGGAWNRSYDHDAAGNRVTQSDGTTTETLIWDGSVVTAIDTAAPVLDPFDAVVEEDDLTFIHDPDGELAEVQDASGVLRSILRDPEGRPLAQRNAEGDERLTFYGLSHGSLPLEVVTEDGEVITEIVVEGVRFGQKRSGEAKPTPIVTDPRGAVLQLGGETLPAFGAFGENTQAPSNFDERHLFAGLESIPEAAGVMLAQHRAYHPRTGRFLSPDPLGLAGGMFRTRYAEGDGVNLVDPTGWTASGPSATDYGQMAESGDDGDGPSKGVEGAGSEKNTSSQSASLCSLSPFACGGMDTGNLGPQRKRGCFGVAPDEGEATGDVDASLTGRKGTSIHTDPATGAQTEVNITVGERCTQDCANRDVFRPAGSTDTYEYINHGPVSGEGALPGGGAQGDGADPTAPGESSGESSPTTEGEGSLIGLGTTREHGGGQDGGGGDGGTGKFRRVSELSRLGDAFDFGVKGGLGIHAAMMLESAPDAIGLLGGPGSGLMQQLAQQALDRSGVVNQMRSWSVEQYRQGMAISPAATNAGVMAGVGSAVLVDVLIPGVGVEASYAARAHRAASTTTVEVATLIGSGGRTLAKHASELHHPIPRFLGGLEKQVLSRIPTNVHQELHSRLRSALKATGNRPTTGGNATRGEWLDYFERTPGSQPRAFETLTDVTAQIDAKYGTKITSDLTESLRQAHYRYFP